MVAEGSFDVSIIQNILAKVKISGLTLPDKNIQVEGVDSSLLLEIEDIKELQNQLNTIASFKYLHTTHEDQLVKIVLVLDANIRTVISCDGSCLTDCFMDTWKENPECSIPVMRAIDSAVATLRLMSCDKISGKILMEDVIHRICCLVKLCFEKIIAPLHESFNSWEKKKTGRKSRSSSLSMSWPLVIQHMYTKFITLFGSLTELIRGKRINEEHLRLTALTAISLFFTCNVLELQEQIIFLLGNIFSLTEEYLHIDLMKLCCQYLSNPAFCKAEVSANTTVRMESLLFLQIVQSVAAMPVVTHDCKIDDKQSIAQSVNRLNLAKRLSSYVLKFFLLGSENEHKKAVFNFIVRDLLSLMKHTFFPISTFLLSIIGLHLTEFLRAKSSSIAVKSYCLELLGSIAAVLNKEKCRLLSSDEELVSLGEKLASDITEKKLTEQSRVYLFQESLIDYLFRKNANCSVEFSMGYYVSAWLQHVREVQPVSEKKSKRKDRKLSKDESNEKMFSEVDFLCKISAAKRIRKRCKKRSYILTDEEALIVARSLTKYCEESLNFENYLNYVVHTITSDNVSLRTKALKSLSIFLETTSEIGSESSILKYIEGHLVVDNNALVREAALELIGRAIYSNVKYLSVYEQCLAERLHDTSIFVRKRVLRIVKQLTFLSFNIDELARLLHNCLYRLTDEESVKKLVWEIFSSFIFSANEDDFYYSSSAQKLIAIAAMCYVHKTFNKIETLFQYAFSENGAMEFVLNKITTCLFQILSAENSSINSTQEKFALILLICHIGKVCPNALSGFIDKVIWFLELSVERSAQILICEHVVACLKAIVSSTETLTEEICQRIASPFSVLLQTSSRKIISEISACCKEIYNRFPSNQNNPVIAAFVYDLQLLHSAKKQFEAKSTDPLPNGVHGLIRALFSIGLFVRHFDFDVIISNEDLERIGISEPVFFDGLLEHEHGFLRSNVFKLLICFSARGLTEISTNALFSLGHFCARYPAFIKVNLLHHLYIAVLDNENEKLQRMKAQVIHNIEMFLLSDEQRITNSDKDFNSAENNLKEMDSIENNTSSIFVQMYWKYILACFVNTDETMREMASDVIFMAIQRGLIHPATCVPTMIAMLSDTSSSVASKMQKQIKDTENRYPDVILGKIALGFREAFKLHQVLINDNHNTCRGFYSLSDGGSERQQAVLGGLYTVYSPSRTQRRSFVNNLLRLFMNYPNNQIDFNCLVFIADNILFFPYETIDEPLYLIRQMDGHLSLTGQNFIAFLKECMNANNDMDEDEIFEIENLSKALPTDKKSFMNVINNGQIAILLSIMKTLLMTKFGLSTKKISDYNLAEPKLYTKSTTHKQISIDEYNEVVSILKYKSSSKVSNAAVVQLSSCINKFRGVLLSLSEEFE